MELLNKIVKSDYMKIAISVALSILAIIISTDVDFKSFELFTKPQSKVVDLEDLSFESYSSHYIFVVDISKSFVRITPSDRVLKRCDKIIAKLREEEFIINNYPNIKLTTDVALLYIIESLLKLKKTSHQNNYFSIWTLGDNPKVILSHSHKAINEKNIKDFIDNCVKKTKSIYSLEENNWTNYLKLIAYLKNSSEKNKQESIHLNLISDFNYSIKGIERDLDFKKEEIIDELERLSSINIKINKIEFSNDTTAEEVYIGNEIYFEDIFGNYNTDHTKINLTSLNKPFVSDFIYPNYEADIESVVDVDADKIAMVKLSKGDYRLNIPFNQTSNISFVEVSTLNSSGETKRKEGKLRDNRTSLNFRIDQDEMIKLKFYGNIAKGVEQTIRLVNPNLGCVYSVPLKFNSKVSSHVIYIILFLSALFSLLIFFGIRQIKNENKKEVKKNKIRW